MSFTNFFSILNLLYNLLLSNLRILKKTHLRYKNKRLRKFRDMEKIKQIINFKNIKLSLYFFYL